MSFKTILYTKQDRVAIIRFNRPEAANGMSSELTTELAQAAQQVADDDELKAVILTGEGRFFSAGGDINAMASATHGAGVEVGLIAGQLHKALTLFAEMSIPLICAVNGTAAGAGFSTAVAGDLVIAAQSAKFTMAYSKVGLSPDGSASYYLPRLIGLRKTQELMYTNRVLSAVEALEWGLVSKVVEDADLMSTALEFAAQFVNGSKSSNASIKSLLHAAYSNSLQQQLDLEADHIARNAESDDGQEGVSAFIAKRAPRFK
jgi:2-(1,2-epoxy-1,2-dihydrophenyl)acetyl-CoA isomerase